MCIFWLHVETVPPSVCRSNYYISKPFYYLQAFVSLSFSIYNMWTHTGIMGICWNYFQWVGILVGIRCFYTLCLGFSKIFSSQRDTACPTLSYLFDILNRTETTGLCSLCPESRKIYLLPDYTVKREYSHNIERCVFS